LPKTIVLDRGPQFASKFWKRLFEVLGVDIRLSTAFHPETDGSTKVTNQVMEQYLRIFCNFKQNDWFQFLPLAEFTYNNSVNSSTKLTPFFADTGVNPLFDPAIPPSSTVPSAEL
jgi:transposase InsO family protein